jgi:hypothetical protein
MSAGVDRLGRPTATREETGSPALAVSSSDEEEEPEYVKRVVNGGGGRALVEDALDEDSTPLASIMSSLVGLKGLGDEEDALGEEEEGLGEEEEAMASDAVYARVKYAYQPEKDGDLALQVGQIVTMSAEQNLSADWLYGAVNGGAPGYFPSSYVQRVSEDEAFGPPPITLEPSALLSPRAVGGGSAAVSMVSAERVNFYWFSSFFFFFFFFFFLKC